jgi:co-chaperonin GroES (HSP10)
LKKIMSEKVIPTGDNVLLEILDQTKTAGGLFIPEKSRGNQRDAIIARVLEVGPGRTTEYGVKIEATSKVGDHVLLSRGAGVEIELAVEGRGKANKKLRIIRDCELLGRIEESLIIQLGLGAP